jgi:ADP-heptose:LPS heptosyltransferase/ubiquinone/menaquinone biosynthesis C-methylase UbiE
MDHNLFKPVDFEDGRNAVVGDCNGISMQDRWKVETPLFAKEILKLARAKALSPCILDYGCGVGRLAKEIITQDDDCFIVGVDASKEMMKQASDYVNSDSFFTQSPQELNRKFDLVYCVYVLQHVPSIEIREILQRIYHHLKDDGIFIYCSSDYRMCIRFDNQGFFDDRFLGVDLQAEVERYFDKVAPLFSDQILKETPILDTMISGANNTLPHPAFVYKKKKLIGNLFDAIPLNPPEIIIQDTIKEFTKLVLINRLAPGDILVMTNAIRDLHLTFPDKYQIEVRSPCNQIFENNPYCTKLVYDENEYRKEESKLHSGKYDGHTFRIKDILFIDMQYPIINQSGEVGSHFSYGHKEFLESVLNIKITQTSIRPEIYLSQSEKDWINPASLLTDNHPYWVINAGSKDDYTLKQYPFYQEVVDSLKDKIRFVQIGLKNHKHISLNNVIDMVGKTDDIRKLFRVINGSVGVLSCVSFPMHIAAAFNKPCVVVAGAREGTRWELYPNQQFLYVNGCLPCAPYDGCWKSKFEDCNNKVDGIVKCMTLITPGDIVRAIERYYLGGMLTY